MCVLQYLVGSTTTTTTTTSTTTATTDTSATTFVTNQITNFTNVTMEPERPKSISLLWTILGVGVAVLAAVLLILITFMLVCRQLVMPRTEGFYDAVYQGSHDKR